MKVQTCFILVLAVLFTVVYAVHGQQEADQRLQAGLYEEDVKGDLKTAIMIYEGIVSNANADRSIRAKAQLHIGMCYEKLGNTEASKAYEVVINRFSEQAEVVAQAKDRLAMLQKEEPAGLTMTRLLPSEVWMECQTLSPDGSKMAGIVFDHPDAVGQNVAVFNLFTEKLNLVTKFDWSGLYTYIPVWSPDGGQIAYLAEGFDDSELWISILNGESRMLYANSYGGIYPCDWFPDGSEVLVVRGNENHTSSLGAVSVKNGSYREIYILGRTYGGRGDLTGLKASVSADVSPDGHLIVFSDSAPEGAGNIYLIDAGGGNPSLLVDHPADEGEPRWSPDGKHIVFLSNRRGSRALWGLAIRDGKADDAPFLIFEGMQDAELAAWNQNGLCYRTMSIINDIYTLEIDPVTHTAVGKPRFLEPQTFGQSLYPLWSPDGKFLAYRTNIQPVESGNLVLMPLKGGEIRKFNYSYRSHPIGGNWQWLADGSGIGFLYFDSEGNLYLSLLDPDTGEWNTQQQPTGDYSFSFLANISWSTDGKAFYYCKNMGDKPLMGIVKHDLKTGHEESLFQVQPEDSLLYGWWYLKASRDGRRLAFHWNSKIAILDIDTGHAEKLEYGDENHLIFPSWSPDGKYLLARRRPGNTTEEMNELFVVPISGGPVQSLNISRYLPPGARIMTSHDWSPDGRTIVFDTRMFKSEVSLIQNVIAE
ncbi:PD40 domain-containing protein [bacterium]|nr:PD40 domain-containing protein [bacterium]